MHLTNKHNNMNKDTLTKKLNEILEVYHLKKKDLMIQYCDANNPYNVGDKFTDHSGTIIIEKIKYSFGDRPCCVFFGAELKKDGTPRKDNNKRNAWQINDRYNKTTTT
jgi:hypothetical protein